MFLQVEPHMLGATIWLYSRDVGLPPPTGPFMLANNPRAAGLDHGGIVKLRDFLNEVLEGRKTPIEFRVGGVFIVREGAA